MRPYIGLKGMDDDANGITCRYIRPFEVAEERQGLQRCEVVHIDLHYLLAHLLRKRVVELEEGKLAAFAPLPDLHVDLRRAGDAFTKADAPVR